MNVLRSVLLIFLFASTATAQRGHFAANAVANLNRMAINVKGDPATLLILEPEPGGFITPGTFLPAVQQALDLGRLAELRPVAQSLDPAGYGYLRYGQTYAGIPVLGAQVTLKVSTTGRPLRLTGNLAPSPNFAPASAPTFPESELIHRARAVLTHRYPHVAGWTVTPRERIWAKHNPWANDPADRYHLTQIFRVSEPAGIRSHLVYLDVTNGKRIFDHQEHCELRRELYHDGTDGPTLQWQEGNPFPAGLDAEDQEMLNATADIYHLFNRTFGRDSYDGNGADMNMISRRIDDCPNASARVTFITHCSGVIADDVVGHEWTHNYNRAMNGLIYQWESGAIDEAYADIFGEIIDLLNTRGTDTGDDQPRFGCSDTGLRWKIGEDVTDTRLPRPLRDMHTPECRNDPGSRNSPNFACLGEDEDFGGVHINSGVVNRSFTLLADGGSLNGTRVNAIGLTKATHLYFHAMNNYIGPRTDFRALADLLLLSAEDLMGINLASLTVVDLPAGFSGEAFTPDDLLQVENALNATGMLESNTCPSEPTLAQNPPASCGENVDLATEIVFSEDWETGATGWSLTQTPVNPATWEDQPWELTGLLPEGRPGQAMFAANRVIGDCETDLENGITSVTSPNISAPIFLADLELRFTHNYSTERNYDGGVLQISLNGGPFSVVPDEAFTYNGYDGRLVPAPFNDNPLAGREAFHGADENRLTGSWGVSVVDLVAAGVQEADRFQLRWSMTSDGCNGWIGWYVDDISVTSCLDGVLPVELTQLRATPQKDGVLLEWATDAEVDNLGFYVERRGDTDASFAEVGFVPAAGPGSTYEFTDAQVLSGRTYFYRLRQADRSGAESYSRVVSASIHGGLRIFPNPASTTITVAGPDGGEVLVADLTGRILARRALVSGRAVFIVDALRPGAYLVRSGEEVRRVIIR